MLVPVPVKKVATKLNQSGPGNCFTAIAGLILMGIGLFGAGRTYEKNTAAKPVEIPNNEGNTQG